MKPQPNSRHPLWNKWRNIQQCLSDWDMPDARVARQRGLQCDWTNFTDFRDDVEAKLGLPKKGQELVRKNFLKGWHLNNLTYATPKEKGSRYVHTLKIKYKGKTWCCKQLSDHCGVPYYTLRRRLHKGWSVNKAVIP